LNIHEHVTCHNVACHWMINTASTDVDGRRRAWCEWALSLYVIEITSYQPTKKNLRTCHPFRCIERE